MGWNCQRANLYHTYQPKICKSLLTASTPSFQAVLPSLLTPLTGLPLHSFSHQHIANCLTNKQYTLLFQWELHLPFSHQCSMMPNAHMAASLMPMATTFSHAQLHTKQHFPTLSMTLFIMFFALLL
jgi:hypothetical protein